jgi:hypothetical protein
MLLAVERFGEKFLDDSRLPDPGIRDQQHDVPFARGCEPRAIA